MTAVAGQDVRDPALSLLAERDTNCYVADAVTSEVDALAELGIRVEVRPVEDPHSPTVAEATACSELISNMERRTMIALDAGEPNPLLLPQGRSAVQAWGPLTKRAVALTNIYNPDSTHLGSGIDASVYDLPVFDKDGQRLSAIQVLVEQLGIDRARSVVAAYERFISEPIDEPSRMIWRGSLDGRGVRTRAQAAVGFVEDWVRRRRTSDPVSMASLACGAAVPVILMAEDLEAKQLAEISQVLLVDIDPMALATASCFTEASRLGGRSRLVLCSLVDVAAGEAADLAALTGPGSIDVVDLLGLFEYLPDGLAVDLLRKVRKVLRPEGLVVFGNMLAERPQQTFFTHVSLWPPLFQRSLTSMLDLVVRAGFQLEHTSIVVPHEGVYAVIAVTNQLSESSTFSSGPIHGRDVDPHRHVRRSTAADRSTPSRPSAWNWQN